MSEKAKPADNSRLGSSRCYLAIVREYRDGMAKVEKSKQLMAEGIGTMLQDLFGVFSLRKIARKTKRSPTYISQVANGKASVSPETYLLLVDLWMENCKPHRELSR